MIYTSVNQQTTSVSLQSGAVQTEPEIGAYSPFIGYLAQSVRKANAERSLHNGRRN